MSPIGRREAIAALCGAAAWPLAARAQQGGQTADHWIPGRDYAAASLEGLPATRLRTGERLHFVP